MNQSSQPQPFEIQKLPDEDERLIKRYVLAGKSVDSLAYTSTFDDLYKDLQKAGDQRPKAEVFRRLLALRKAGQLPRIG